MRPGKLSLQRHGTGGEGASYYSASYTFRRKSRTDYVRSIEEQAPCEKSEMRPRATDAPHFGIMVDNERIQGE